MVIQSCQKLMLNRPAIEAYGASAGVLLVLLGVKHAAQALPGVAEYILVIATAFQLYLPLLRMQPTTNDTLSTTHQSVNSVTNISLGLIWGKWSKALKTLIGTCVVIGAIYAFCSHIWMTQVLNAELQLIVPSNHLSWFVIEVLAIALPEELFFRGYLQERFSLIFKGSFKPILITSVVFALAHFVGEYSPLRLLTFFPSLVFGLLRVQTGTLWPSIGFHAFCNILQRLISLSYR